MTPSKHDWPSYVEFGVMSLEGDGMLQLISSALYLIICHRLLKYFGIYWHDCWSSCNPEDLARG